MTDRKIGEVYSSQHSENTKTTQYYYRDGIHDLALFWAKPTLNLETAVDRSQRNASK